MIKELNLNPDNGTDVIMAAYVECGTVEIDKLPRGVACQGAGDGRPRRGRNWDRKILYRKKYFHECRLSAVFHVDPDDNHKVRIRTYWRPWLSWSRCPRGRGCLRQWRGRCTTPRPTWRPPPAPAGSRTLARRRNSAARNESDKLYRRPIKHKPNWSRGGNGTRDMRYWENILICLGDQRYVGEASHSSANWLVIKPIFDLI